MARNVHVRILPGCRGLIRVPELRRIASGVLDAENVARDVEVEVVLADSATVRELNRLYRGRDEPTDVLSFATADYGEVEATFVDDEPRSETPVFVEAPDEAPSLGEVIVCLPVAVAQAEARGHPVAGEIAHLLVHGLLHLGGHDHELDDDEAKMKSREDELLAALGFTGQYEHGH